MERYCDLHVHSRYSDGTCTPAQLLELAEAAGLQAIALCDHNTIDGIADFLSAGENSPVEAIPGIEISTDFEGAELQMNENGICEIGYKKFDISSPEYVYGDMTMTRRPKIIELPLMTSPL